MTSGVGDQGLNVKQSAAGETKGGRATADHHFMRLMVRVLKGIVGSTTNKLTPAPRSTHRLNFLTTAARMLRQWFFDQRGLRVDYCSCSENVDSQGTSGRL